MIIKYINKNNFDFNLQDFDNNNFNNLSKIYSFTTENIGGYFKKIDFLNKNVLTIAASGDHIINAFYKGANEVYGFDINFLALIYTELKLIALQNLKYNEFLNFFMINSEKDINKNKDALNYSIYCQLRKFLSRDCYMYWDELYKKFNNNGYELRNSFIFNNKYDSNTLKINSNLYLKSEKDYNIAKEKIKNKNIILINSNYQNIKSLNLPNLAICDIILMSNISDYIEKIYKKDYFEEYIKEITKLFKNDANKIVCAYLYDIHNESFRSQIDNPLIRHTIFNKLNIVYTEEHFRSVIDNCIDSVVII